MAVFVALCSWAGRPELLKVNITVAEQHVQLENSRSQAAPAASCGPVNYATMWGSQSYFFSLLGV